MLLYLNLLLSGKNSKQMVFPIPNTGKQVLPMLFPKRKPLFP